MDSKVLTTIAVTGFSVAFFHAAIPTHWLPFVLTGRVQKWSRGRTNCCGRVSCGGLLVVLVDACEFAVAVFVVFEPMETLLANLGGCPSWRLRLLLCVSGSVGIGGGGFEWVI